MINNKAYLTAIKRNKVSAPMQYLLDKKLLLIGIDILDYGCGRGFDAQFFGFYKYDPHYFPNDQLLSLKWDCIVCNYVLNVVDENVADEILKKIHSMLSNKGTAYITVRRDVKENGFTSKGTFQRDVKLNLPIVKEARGNYCIYRLDKSS